LWLSKVAWKFRLILYGCSYEKEQLTVLDVLDVAYIISHFPYFTFLILIFYQESFVDVAIGNKPFLIHWQNA